MTTFKEIRGTTVESVSSDPTNPEVGQIWYNNTIGVLKGNLLVADAWASGGNLGTRRTAIGGAGTQTAGLAIGGGGVDPAGAVFPGFNNTEEYDGSAWAAGGNLTTARYSLAGAGTQTAGLGFGGYVGAPTFGSTATEEYNGTSWSAGGNFHLLPKQSHHILLCY